MTRNMCYAETTCQGTVYVCTKGRNHQGPHCAFDATTNLEFYRDERDDRPTPRSPGASNQ